MFLYSWLENESLKGSNEIASAVYDCLKRNEPLMENIHTIRLISDGCVGQNKNCTVLTMCLKWLYEAPSNVRQLNIFFPVTGHSFMPPDRVFGVIERKLKKTEEIIRPEQYYDIFKKRGQLLLLGKDWRVKDWKQQTDKIVKSPASLHFKISQIKRLSLERSKDNTIKVSGDLTYNCNTSNCLSVTKRNKKIKDINPSTLDIGTRVKDAKIQDVKCLLAAHFGNNWENREDLRYYQNVCTGHDAIGQCEAEHIEAPECEFVQEVDYI